MVRGTSGMDERMRTAKKRGLGVLFTLAVIAALVFSGSVTALTLGITNLVDNIGGNQNVSFIARVDLHTPDVLRNDVNWTVTMTNTVGEQNYSCTFNIDADELTACTGIVVTVDLKKVGAALLGYGYGYGYGYDYSTGYYVTDSKNLSAAVGYGYGYTSGYGYGDFTSVIGSSSELAYNITWSAPAVTSNTDYSIGFLGFVSDGTNAVRYEAKGSNIGDITVVTVTQAATDASLLAGVKDSLTYSLLTQDLTTDPQLRVISDLYMPTSLNGVDISWATNDSAAINTTGGVTRNTANHYVQLTASLNRSAATDSKIFDLVVKAAVAAVAPDENLTVELGENDTEVFFNATTIQNISIIIVPPTIEANVTVSLNFEEIINTTAVENKKVIDVSAQNLTLERQANVSGVDINYTAEIPIGTRIIAPPTWNGVINLPTVQIAANFTAPEDEGGSAATVEAVIDVGSSVELNFTQPVKITIGGQAGKRAGWSRGNASLTDIPTQCNDVDNPTNINNQTPRECYIDSGNDLIVWTYHFTSFAAYTPTTTVTTTTTTTSASASGSGGISVPATKTIVLIDAGKAYTVNRRDSFAFTLGGESHTLKVDKINTDDVQFTFTSDPIQFTLLVGQHQRLLVGGETLLVRLDRIKNGKAEIFLQLIPAAKPVVSEPEAEREDVEAEDGVPEEDESLDVPTGAAVGPSVAKVSYDTMKKFGWAFGIALLLYLIVMRHQKLSKKPTKHVHHEAKHEGHKHHKTHK